MTFESDRPRLMITHIENENFKSYYGKQTLGPFHKSFSSIVGPNGSGKSNVIDSMLFVFGYRAQKIRSKKISVLIHDSDTHPDVRSCKVKVFFQVSDVYFRILSNMLFIDIGDSRFDVFILDFFFQVSNCDIIKELVIFIHEVSFEIFEAYT